MMIAVYLAVIHTPPHDVMGDVQRIFYFHVPAAWVGYLAFFFVFASSILYLKTNNRLWDHIAIGSAEIGVMFTTLAIVTGPLWAKAIWGVYWYWEDLKLFMTLVLWLIFLAYLALRSATASSEHRARLAAVFGIIGFLCVPLSFVANRIWRQYHPTVIASSEGSLQPIMAFALVVGVIAFTLLYFYLLIMRVDLEILTLKIEEYKEQIGGD
jgi:heme exporter protein C